MYTATVTMLSYLVIGLLWPLLHLSVCTHSSNEDKIPLHFAYITSKTGGFVANGSIPIVNWLLEIINERDDILQNYTLNYTDVLDSKVNTNKNTFSNNFCIHILYKYIYVCVCVHIKPCTLECNLFLQCDHTASLDAFFKLFWQSNTTYVTLLGCGCSSATIPVAETSHYWNIPQV